MTNIVVSSHYADFLDQFAWSHFCTFTTRYELTLQSARRLMGNFHGNVKKAGRTPFFWVAEKFEVKDGFHTHALLKVPDAWRFQNIVDIWQKVSRGARSGSKCNYAKLLKYEKDKGATHYVGKYITKELADYDFLF